MKALLCIVAAVFLHAILGWEWTVLAGVLCGFVMERRSWLWGCLTVAAGWGIFVLIDYFAAREPVLRMLDATGQILGNLPGALVVVLTLLIGGMLGTVGGLIGSRLAQLIPPFRLYGRRVS